MRGEWEKEVQREKERVSECRNKVIRGRNSERRGRQERLIEEEDTMGWTTTTEEVIQSGRGHADVGVVRRQAG